MTNIQTECTALQGNKHEYASGQVVCIRTECIKLRRAPIWLAFAGLPAAATLIGSANYGGNLGELTPGWEALWSQQTLFLCYFFLPALIGVGASYLWRFEHEGTNWHELMTQPVPAWCIFGAKLVVGVALFFGGAPFNDRLVLYQWICAERAGIISFRYRGW